MEHYPDMREYKVVELGGEHVIAILDRDGRKWLDAEPIFHGGPGSTLEMRLFACDDIVRHLEQGRVLRHPCS